MRLKHTEVSLGRAEVIHCVHPFWHRAIETDGARADSQGQGLRDQRGELL